SGAAQGHILDGGYFESSGLTTAGDIVRAAQRYGAETHRPVQPIVIELNNDSDADPASPVFTRGWTTVAASGLFGSPTKYFLSDFLGPITGLTQSRDGHATPAAIMLSRSLISPANAPDQGVS